MRDSGRKKSLSVLIALAVVFGLVSVAAAQDVAPKAILSPKSTVTSADTAFVIAAVHNADGYIAAVFKVEFSIDSIDSFVAPFYVDSALAYILGPHGVADTLFFVPWIVPDDCESDEYYLRVVTDYAADTHHENDTLVDTVTCVSPVLHDVRVDSIYAPADTLAGSDLSIGVLVRNLGDSTEICSLTCIVDTLRMVQDSVQVPGNSPAYVAFDEPWPIPLLPCDTSYQITVSAGLPGDLNPYNDTLKQSIYVKCLRHDVGVVSTNAPPDTVAGDTLSLQATVRNYGDVAETFDVIYSVGNSEDTFAVVSLPPDDIETVVFDRPWAIPSSPCNISYVLSTWVELPGDSDYDNDTLVQNVFAKCPSAVTHDVGVFSTNAPADTVAGDTLSFEAIVVNSGDSVETFDVIYRVGSSGDTFSVAGLQPGHMDTVAFDVPWMIPAFPCDTSYVLSTWVELAGDLNPDNDTLSSNIFVRCTGPVRVRDIGVVWIDAPAETLAGCSLVSGVKVRNFGDTTELFDVSYELGTISATEDSILLARDRDTVVTFGMQLPYSPCGISYPIVVSTRLHDVQDDNTYNDTLRQSIHVICPTGMPDTFSLQYPVDNAVLTDSVVQFQWEGDQSIVSGSVEYELFLSTDSVVTSEDTVVYSGKDSTFTGTFYDNFSRYWRVKAVSEDSIRWSREVFHFSIVTTSDHAWDKLVPLLHNFPNPVRSGGTTVKYLLTKPAKVTMRIYDTSGHLVRELLADEEKEIGVHYETWDGKDHGGSELANGVYLCEITVKATQGGAEEKQYRRIAILR